MCVFYRDLLMLVDVLEEKKNVFARTLIVVGIGSVLGAVTSTFKEETCQRVTKALIAEFCLFSSEGDGIDDFSLSARFDAFSATFSKFNSRYDDFCPLIEAILRGTNVAVRKNGSLWVAKVLKGSRLQGINSAHLTDTLFRDPENAAALIALSPGCFWLFETCFMFANGMDEKSQFKIKALPIRHLSDLLCIVLSTDSESCFAAASGLLVRALDAVSLEDLGEMNAFRRTFVTGMLLPKASESRAATLKVANLLYRDTAIPHSNMDSTLKELVSRFPSMDPNSTIFLAALSACPESVDGAAAFVEELVNDETFDEGDYALESVVGSPGVPYSELMSSDPEISERMCDILFGQDVVAKAKSADDLYALSGLGLFTSLPDVIKSCALPRFKRLLESGQLFSSGPGGSNEEVLQKFFIALAVLRAKLVDIKDVGCEMLACAESFAKVLEESGSVETVMFFVSILARIAETSCDPIPGLGKLFNRVFVFILCKWVMQNKLENSGDAVAMIGFLSKILTKCHEGDDDEIAGTDFSTKGYAVLLKLSPEASKVFVPLLNQLCVASTKTYAGVVSKLAKYILCGNSKDVKETKGKVLLGNVFPAFFCIYNAECFAQNRAVFTEEFLGNSVSQPSSVAGITMYFDSNKLLRRYTKFFVRIGAGAYMRLDHVERLFNLLGKDRKSTEFIANLLRAIFEKHNADVSVARTYFAQLRRVYDEAACLGTINDSERVRPTKFCGLENTSSTCYANSAIQLLYMSEFRYHLLELPIMDKKPDAFKSEDDAKQFELCKGVIVDLQNLFMDMLLSNKEYCNPTNMIKSFWEGFGEQDDIHTFLVTVINKASTYEKAIKTLSDSCSTTIGWSMYTKKTSEIVCPAGHSLQKEGHDSVLSLCIDNADTLEDAIRESLKAEMVHDYVCPKCGNVPVTVEISKELESVGDTLILRLNRVSFDPATGVARKNPKNVFFGREMDVSKFVGKSSEADVFVLSGVVMHVGDANSGHYYSFMRDPSPGDGKREKWYKFNDRTVMPWDIDECLESDCYGSGELGDPDVSKSVYILLYTRKGVASNLTPEEFMSNFYLCQNDDDDDDDSIRKNVFVKDVLARNEMRKKLDVLLNPCFNRLAADVCKSYFEPGPSLASLEADSQEVLSRTTRLFTSCSRFPIAPWLAEVYGSLTRFFGFDDALICSCEPLLKAFTSPPQLALFLDILAKAVVACSKERGTGEKVYVLEQFFKMFFNRYISEDRPYSNPPPSVFKFVLDVLEAKNRMLNEVIVSSFGLHMLTEIALKPTSSPETIHGALQAISQIIQQFQVGGNLGRNIESPLVVHPTISQINPSTGFSLSIFETYVALIGINSYNPEAVATILHHVINEASYDDRQRIVSPIIKIIIEITDPPTKSSLYFARIAFEAIGSIPDPNTQALILAMQLSFILTRYNMIFNLSSPMPEDVRIEAIKFINSFSKIVKSSPVMAARITKKRETAVQMNMLLGQISNIIEANPKTPINEMLSQCLSNILSTFTQK